MLGRYLPLKYKIDLCMKSKNIVPHFFMNSELIDLKGIQNAKTGTPASSFLRAHIPITDHKDKFIWQSKKVRIGRLLEIMDSLSGISGFLYCREIQNEITLATAVMDNFYSHEQIQPKDLEIQAVVTNSGKTSLEVITNIVQDGKVKAEAAFVMVCRNLKDYSARKVPELLIENDEPNLKYINQQSKHRDKQRKSRREERSKEFFPTGQDFYEIHKLLNCKSKNGVSIQSTKLNTTIILHEDTKNYHGKVFGGLLMRLAYETSYITARQFYNGGNFKFVFINDVMFLKPVDLGSIIELRAKVIYTMGRYVLIKCEVWTKKYEVGENEEYTEMMICFEQECESRQVYPSTYNHAISYIRGKSLKYFKDK